MATAKSDLGKLDRKKSLTDAVQSIEKQFGKGSIMRLGENLNQIKIETISTGCLSLDIALGCGGLPKGRITEIYGPESSGKTTLTLHAIAEAQKEGGTCAFIDAEHALDTKYAEKIPRIKVKNITNNKIVIELKI